METVYKRIIEGIERATNGEQFVDSFAEVTHRDRIYSVAYLFRREYLDCHFPYDEEPHDDYVQYLEIINWDVMDLEGNLLSDSGFRPSVIEDYFSTQIFS